MHNFDKSSLLFGKRVHWNVRHQIKYTLGIQNEKRMWSYLRIPEDIIGSNCKLFSFLKHRLLNRVKGWTGRWLSKERNEVLIKSNLLDLLIYVMSSFIAPWNIWKSHKWHCTILVKSIHQKEEFTRKNRKSFIYLEKKTRLVFVWSLSSVCRY